MSYTQTERNALKKKARDLATILGDDFLDLENQGKDRLADFFKEYAEEANQRVIQGLIDKKINLGSKKAEPIPSHSTVETQANHKTEMEHN